MKADFFAGRFGVESHALLRLNRNQYVGNATRTHTRPRTKLQKRQNPRRKRQEEAAHLVLSQCSSHVFRAATHGQLSALQRLCVAAHSQQKLFTRLNSLAISSFGHRQQLRLQQQFTAQEIRSWTSRG